jgi:AbrB family looped-hinge helix DNA binding protein
MSKTIYKIMDSKNRILIPQDMRQKLDVSAGDIVGLTEDKGRLTVKKAIAVDDGPMTTIAKECYVKSVVKEFDAKALTEILEIIAKLLQERKPKI